MSPFDIRARLLIPVLFLKFSLSFFIVLKDFTTLFSYLRLVKQRESGIFLPKQGPLFFVGLFADFRLTIRLGDAGEIPTTTVVWWRYKVEGSWSSRICVVVGSEGYVGGRR